MNFHAKYADPLRDQGDATNLFFANMRESYNLLHMIVK